jgi:hypothetical protein
VDYNNRFEYRSHRNYPGRCRSNSDREQVRLRFAKQNREECGRIDDHLVGQTPLVIPKEFVRRSIVQDRQFCNTFLNGTYPLCHSRIGYVKLYPFSFHLSVDSLAYLVEEGPLQRVDHSFFHAFPRALRQFAS